MTRNLTSSLEDYLEGIWDMGGVARVSDLAARMGVAKASVNGAGRRLAELGLADFPPYGHITLTKRGRALAAGVRRRHNALLEFLVEGLGVSPAVAEKDACVLEHGLSRTTARRLMEFVTRPYRLSQGKDVG